jgi:hypothetical protein
MPTWTAKMTPDHFKTVLHTKQYDVAYQIYIHERINKSFPEQRYCYGQNTRSVICSDGSTEVLTSKGTYEHSR